MKTILYILLIFNFIYCDIEKNNTESINNSNNNNLNNNNKNNKLEDFSYEISTNNLIRFKENEHVFTRKEFLDVLSNNDEKYDKLRTLINQVLANKSPEYPYSLKLKSPPINKANENKDFFWLIQKHKFDSNDIVDKYKNYLLHCEESFINSDINSDDYTKRFIAIVSQATLYDKNSLKINDKYKNAAVIFNNIVQKDRLIIPCPFTSKYSDEINKPLLNISSYMKLLNKEQDDYQERNNNFWLAVGLSTKDYEANISKTIFLTTHGTGVYYFHFRIDSLAYDYNDLAKKIINEPAASDFYTEEFK